MNGSKQIPKNVGIITDGNGRWAEKRGLSRSEGHTVGIMNMLRIIESAFALGAENVVCYSLSTENLARPRDELDHILSLVIKYFDKFVNTLKGLRVCTRIVGDLELLPENIRESLKRTEDILSEFDGCKRTLYIAVAYGGRSEIVNAVNRAVISGQTVTEESLLRLLCLPISLDLVIRTGGKRRLSNFFLYQCSYAELYFSDKLFPDFDSRDLEDAFEWFSNQKRSFGK